MKLRWTLALLAAVALLGAVAALSRPGGPSVRVAGVKRGSLLVPIQCDGTLEPPPGGELRTPQAAIVAEILARDGDRVTVGTPLVRLEDAELSRKALESRSDALRLEAERATAAADLADLERQERRAASVVDADARLLGSGAITRMTVEQNELTWNQAQDRVRAARARLTALEGAAQGRASRVALSEQAAAELERRVASLMVRAPAAGIVYGLPRRVGEAVEAGQVVANVIDPAHRRLRARVDQPDLPQAAVGQRLIVSFDGLPHERWDGRVTFVDPGLREAGGRLVGDVLGDVADPQGNLPSNAAVDVQIVTGEKSGVLLVPRSGVFRDGERRYLYILDDGRARRREVSVGLLGLTEAEILAGVKEGEAVILPGATALSDGLRVRAADAKT